MTISTNNTLTIRDRETIIACLNDYRDLCIESAGDVNIMGLSFEEDAKLRKAVDDIINRVNNDALLDDDFKVIYSCFDDAVDQYNVTNGECGFIQSEEDFATVQAIRYKLQHNSVPKYVMDTAPMVTILSSAMLGAYGPDIYSVRQVTWDALCAWSKHIVPDLTYGDILMAWAMVLVKVTDLSDANNLDKVYDKIDALNSTEGLCLKRYEQAVLE